MPSPLSSGLMGKLQRFEGAEVPLCFFFFVGGAVKSALSLLEIKAKVCFSATTEIIIKVCF